MWADASTIVPLFHQQNCNIERLSVSCTCTYSCSFQVLPLPLHLKASINLHQLSLFRALAPVNLMPALDLCC